MSLYGNRCSIGGLSCGMVLRGAANGEYRAVFERESACLLYTSDAADEL